MEGHEVDRVLRRFINADAPITQVAVNEVVSAQQVSELAPEQPDMSKPARKPRADAGKSRGPNKTTTGEPAASEPGQGANSVATAPAAPATPTPIANPQDGGKELTLDDARAALGRINQTASLGMPACMQHLTEFKVNRISLLEKKDFALFIKQADAKVAEAVAAAK